MLAEQILFFLAAAVALGGALGVVAARNPFYSVLSLVVHLIALAVLFLLLRAQFVAAAQVVVYAGAVVVMYLFVVAYVGGEAERIGDERTPIVTSLAPLFAAALFIELLIAIAGSGLAGLDTNGPRTGLGFGGPGEIGELLLERFLLPFEAVSLVLLAAAVGAVVLARRRRGLEDLEQELRAEPVVESDSGAFRLGPLARAGVHGGW